MSTDPLARPLWWPADETWEGLPESTRASVGLLDALARNAAQNPSGPVMLPGLTVPSFQGLPSPVPPPPPEDLPDGTLPDPIMGHAFPGYTAPTSIIRAGDCPVWSTYRFTPSSGGFFYPLSVELFRDGRGRVGQGFVRPLVHVDTNLKEGGRIPGGLRANIRTAAWQVWGCSADVGRLMESGSWAFDFRQTRVDGTPLGVLHRAGGISAEDEDWVGSRDFNGRMCARGFYDFTDPVEIPAGVPFGVCVHLPDNFQPRDELFLRFYLFGRFESVVAIG